MAPQAEDRTNVSSPSIPPVSRFSLDPALGRGAVLGGGWWPHSRDASAELPSLVVLLNSQVGVVVRLGVDARDWDDIPHRIVVGGHRVRGGWFADLNHEIIVTRGPQDHIMLLVATIGRTHLGRCRRSRSPNNRQSSPTTPHGDRGHQTR
jgi:Family of unknown function (DUF5994)